MFKTAPNPQKFRGFTVIELVVAVAVYAILISLTLKGTVNPQVTATVDSTINTLISDIKQQQIKAMISFTADESTGQQFGVYFESDAYTLFTGSSYSALDPDNFKVELPDGLSFTEITFPSSSLVFNRRSGEVTGYNSATDSVRLKHEDSSSRLFELNKYGAISLY